MYSTDVIRPPAGGITFVDTGDELMKVSGTELEALSRAGKVKKAYNFNPAFRVNAESVMNCCGMRQLTQGNMANTGLLQSHNAKTLYSPAGWRYENPGAARDLEARLRKDYPELYKELRELRLKSLRAGFYPYREYGSGLIMVDRAVSWVSDDYADEILFGAFRMVEIMELTDLPGRRYLMPPFINEGYRGDEVPYLWCVLWIPRNMSVPPEAEEVVMAGNSFPNKGFRSPRGGSKCTVDFQNRLATLHE